MRMGDVDDRTFGAWTIHDLEVLFHYRCCPTVAWPYGETPAHGTTVSKLVEAGLMDRADFPAVTERGLAFIDMLLATPVPVQKFVDPRFEQ